MGEQIEPVALSNKGKLMMWLIVLSIALTWIFAIYAYLKLPQTIPTHFGSYGEVTNYGGKSVFLITPIVSSSILIIFPLMVRYRFTLINKYPYIISLPAFFTLLSEIQKERKGIWINRVFEAVLAIGVFFGFYFLVLEYGDYLGEISNKLPRWFTPFVVLAPLLAIVPYYFYLRNLSKEMKKEAEGAL